MRAYFNFIYNPVYDATVAKLNHYQKLQRRCTDKLELADNDSVLCVGLGTGNEIYPIVQANRNVNIVGVDFSKIALIKAYKKALRLGKEIEIFTMDARCLEFATGTFDKVICLHVMDFVNDREKVTSEMLRVLKGGGQFVITYPSGKEDAALGLGLFKDNIHHLIASGKNYIEVFGEVLLQSLAGIVCLPMLLRSNKKVYSKQELESIVTILKPSCFVIEEDILYHDFIVYGKKQE